MSATWCPALSIELFKQYSQKKLVTGTVVSKDLFILDCDAQNETQVLDEVELVDVTETREGLR